MKSQKGITLTSLVLYIMLVLVVLGILSVITASFQSNLKEVNKEGTKNSEVDSFNMYFLQEVKKQGNKISTISENEVLFTTGNKFSFRENMIYLNDNIKIAENIENCAFSDSLENGKTIITVTIKARNSEEKIIDYVLNNDEIATNYEHEDDYISKNVILPSDYQQVEYVGTTGTQYIDTGVTAQNQPSIETNFCITSSTPGTQAILGCRSVISGAASFVIFANVNGKNLRLDWTGVNTINYSIVIDKYNELILEANGTVIVNGTEYANRTVKTSSPYNILLGNFNDSNGSPRSVGAYAKWKTFKIYENDVIVRNFIPCYRISDDVIGLYDLVNDIFYTNAGTGDFIAGPEV